jgi:beta-lactamase superfamily II metal-dependent hydrolase
MATSLAWSTLHSLTNPALTLTALDTARELALVATLPKGQAMVINAGASRYVDTSAKINTALIHHLHTLRLGRLDYLAALTVTKENAGTLLALAREFDVREFWYSGDRPSFQRFWELRNLLGDARKEVINLSLAPLTREIGGVLVETRQLPGNFPDRGSGPVLLHFTCQGQSVLVIPPASASWRRQCLAAGLTPSNVIILPASHLRDDFLSSCLSQVKPQIVVVTGLPADVLSLPANQPSDLAWHFTRRGAVTVTVSSGKVHLEQWQP